MNETALIISDIDNAKVWLATDANARKEKILALSKTVTAVTNSTEDGFATQRRRDIKRLLAEVETTRKAIKQPVLNLGKRIDQIAADYLQALIDEESRIARLSGAWTAAEQRKVDEENERLAAAQRKAQQDAAEALAEQERLANLAKPSPKKEIAAEVAVQAAQEKVIQAQAAAPAFIPKVSGKVVKREVMFEITDAAALYAVRPEFFTLEPRRSAIKASINKDTRLPGLKCWEAVSTSVRT